MMVERRFFPVVVFALYVHVFILLVQLPSSLCFAFSTTSTTTTTITTKASSKLLSSRNNHGRCDDGNHNINNNNNNGYNLIDRRDVIITNLLLFGGGVIAATSSLPAPAIASITSPDPQFITTVILDSAESKIGVGLSDIKIGSKSFAAVTSVAPSGEAAISGIQPGMVILGNNKETPTTPSASVVNRIKNGPYPIVLQFYNLAEGTEAGATTAADGLALAQKEAATPVKEPPLTAAGAGLITKTVRKSNSDCTEKARRGDTVSIKYEARVASPGGPIYDSTKERGVDAVTFVLGDGQAINGVNIGMGDMCVGEIREIDIPSALGYGRFGSQILDIPGGVRLWWRVELLSLTKKGNKGGGQQ